LVCPSSIIDWIRSARNVRTSPRKPVWRHHAQTLAAEEEDVPCADQ
jgi:hypothetical protein